MILGRVTEHLHKQDWTAIAIDFLIVVVGVFVGLQMQEWAAARADRQTEAETLRAIADDLRLELDELSAGRDGALASIKAANAALVAAGEPRVMAVTTPTLDRWLGTESLHLSALDDTPPADEANIWKPIVARPFPTSSSVAFDTLVSAGRLGIIRNGDLIHRLQRYRHLWRGLEESQLSTFREFRNAAVYAGQALGLSPFTKTSTPDLARLLRDDPRLKGAVRTTSEYAIVHYRVIEQLEKQAKSLLQIIEAELAR